MSESAYYVGIEEADDLRKDVLESAKHSVEILKSKKQLNYLRDQRHEKVTELQELLADMRKRVSQLTKQLPKHNKKKLPKAIKEAEKRIKKKRGEREQEKQVRKPASSKKLAASKSTSLVDVKGIGPARAKKLQQAGIESAEQLAQARAQDISTKTGIVLGTVKKLVTRAQEATQQQAPPTPDAQAPAPPQQSEDERLDEDINLLESKLDAIERKLNNL